MDTSSRKENTPTTNQESSAPSTPGPSREGFLRRRSRRFSSVLHRVSSQWNFFLLKIKSATQVSYSDEEVLDSLFESSDEDFFERVPRSRKCCNFTGPEVRFLEEYKKYDSLDKYYEAHQDMPSSSASKSVIPYQALDVSRLREDREISPVSSENELRLTKKEALLKDRMMAKEGNLGNALWEIRRARWLTPNEEDVEEKLEQRAAGSSIKHISRDLYPRIYRDFVEKAKPLKEGKRISLEDMVVVINAGWVHEKVWESASKGLG